MAQANADEYKSGDLNLYEIFVRSQDEAQTLQNSGLDVILKVERGYLALAGAEQEKTLRESGLEFQFLAGDLNRDRLALDIRLDGQNIDHYQVVYEEPGLRLVRVEPSDLLEDEGNPGLAPLLNRRPRITWKEPVKLQRAFEKETITLDSLVGLIRQDSLESYVYTLQAFPPRVTGSASDIQSRNWIMSKFQEFGYDSVVYDTFYYNSQAVQNIIAYKIGTDFPEHHIVIGGHKDAVSGSPGADDNGSGTAGVLEMARVMKDLDTRMTFIFICFDGEEQGLHGSWHYADAAAARGDSIVMMLNMDMIAYEGNTNDVKVYHGSDVTYPNLWIDLAETLNGVDLDGFLSGTITASDHYPFQQNGYDVVFLIEYNFSSVYHTFRDSTSYMDFAYMSKIVKASLATAYEVNNTYTPVPGLTFSYPEGRPESVYPGAATAFEVQVVGSSGGVPVPGSGILYYRPAGGSVTTVPMDHLGGNLYEATIPAHGCDDNRVEYWFSADEGTVGTQYDGSASAPYKAPVATAVISGFYDDFETNLGWTSSGGTWARGIPAGGGGSYGNPDPTGGTVGPSVLGYNLNGDYTGDMPERHMTSPAIDCSGLAGVTLRFDRWLGVEQPQYDHAYVRVSRNGTTWNTVWQNTVEIADGQWTPQEFDISAYADNQPVVYIRFTMGITDGAWNYCGWNVDNLSLIGFQCQANLPIILTESLPDWTLDVMYSQQLEGLGGTGILTWTDKDNDLAGTGLALSSTGLLSGMPDASKTITFVAMVTDEALATNEKRFTFDINPALDITTATLPDADENTPYSHQLAATGGTGGPTWSDKNGDLASTGLALSASGLLSGTPTVYGEIGFTARVQDQVGAEAEKPLTLSIAPYFICGDADDDGIVNLLDIVYLIDWKYKSGPAPLFEESSDVNSDSTVDILDIIYMIDFKFKGGPAPVCP